MEQLLEDVKNYLDITWEMDASETQKLTGIIARGKTALEGKIGTCDFENETVEKQLLLDYCMYTRSGALDDFWNNYKSEIISLQIGRWADAKNKES